MDYGYGLLSFFTVAFGGLAIGVLMGLVSGLLTRATREVWIIAIFVNFHFYFLRVLGKYLT
jgi:NhaP-type Na+/H+ or K+/H+ antiporter